MSVAVWLLALVPVAGLAVNVGSQVILCRTARSLGLLRSLILGFGTGWLFALVSTLALGNFLDLATDDLLAQMTVSGLTTAALGYCYFHFVNLGETARRVRILRELTEAGGQLSREELLKRYNSADMVRQRLGRLLRSGQVVLRDGHYFIGKPTVLRMARAVELVGRIVGLRHG